MLSPMKKKQRMLSPMNHAIGFWQLEYNEKFMDSQPNVRHEFWNACKLRPKNEVNAGFVCNNAMQ